MSLPLDAVTITDPPKNLSCPDYLIMSAKAYTHRHLGRNLHRSKSKDLHMQ